jgi:hypothetical protein
MFQSNLRITWTYNSNDRHFGAHSQGWRDPGKSSSNDIVRFVIKSGRAAVVELQCKLWRICIAKSLYENHPWIIYRDEPLLSTIVSEEEWALHLLLSVSKHEHGQYLWHTIPSLLLLSCHAYPTEALLQDCNGCWNCCHFDPTQWENMLFGPLEVQLCISIGVILLGGSSLQRNK